MIRGSKRFYAFAEIEFCVLVKFHDLRIKLRQKLSFQETQCVETIVVFSQPRVTLVYQPSPLISHVLFQQNNFFQ